MVLHRAKYLHIFHLEEARLEINGRVDVGCGVVFRILGI